MCHSKGISSLPRRRLWDDLPRVMPGDTNGLPPNIYDPRKRTDPTPTDGNPDPRDRGGPNDPRNNGRPNDPRFPGRPGDPRVPGPSTSTQPTPDPRRGGETPRPN